MFKYIVMHINNVTFMKRSQTFEPLSILAIEYTSPSSSSQLVHLHTWPEAGPSHGQLPPIALAAPPGESALMCEVSM